LVAWTGSVRRVHSPVLNSCLFMSFASGALEQSPDSLWGFPRPRHRMCHRWGDTTRVGSVPPRFRTTVAM